MNVSFAPLTLTEKTKWGEGRSKTNVIGGSRAAAKAFGGPGSSVGVDFWRTEIWICTLPEISKKKKKNHRCRCGAAASRSSVRQLRELCGSCSASGACDSRDRSAIYPPASGPDPRTAAGPPACGTVRPREALCSENRPSPPKP